MYIVRVLLIDSRPHGAARVADRPPGLLGDLLWAHARPSDRFEHISIRSTGTGLEAVIFLRATSESSALTGVREFFLRVRGPLAAHDYAPVVPTF
ncbi:hypothetical protein OHA37_28175 [Streptomyces sp. NBC_00335]|uniref:hypothetical protein n=1 Tax=unclassified Streptomyces TaxID=2593676 RepID=UPI00225766B9|nr:MULTISPECIES: hypothetical protein [unclassified Streptomyces]MCX5407730.1 hypothetical protein [Streptomyces sp. NBC_00086]